MCTVVLVSGSIALLAGWLGGIWTAPHLDRFVEWLEERNERRECERDGS